jgi:hypothetical protein
MENNVIVTDTETFTPSTPETELAEVLAKAFYKVLSEVVTLQDVLATLTSKRALKSLQNSYALLEVARANVAAARKTTKVA